VSITLPPFEVGTAQYIRWLGILTRSRDEDFARSILDVEPRFIFSESEENPREAKKYVYDLSLNEQNKLRELIKAISVENFVDDLSDWITCDGSTLNLSIENHGGSIDITNSNLNEGFKVVGLGDLLSFMLPMTENLNLQCQKYQMIIQK